ncbi:MAG: TRAP transporter substrate-binding protein DctP [Desulfobacter sp.]|nr:MAG: TRAP transporter substrate-binding protein DctP [Desulfobacter sp.]
MKKFCNSFCFSSLLTALLVLGLMVPMTASAKTKLVLSHYSQTDTATNGIAASALYFKTLVEARSNNEIEVKVFGNMVLGNCVEYTRECIKGDTVQVAVLYSGAFSSFYQDYQMLNTPFLFDSYRTAWKFFNGKYFSDMMEDCRKKTGLRHIASLDDGGGFVAFTNNKRLIKTPADMKGLRIRTEENPAQIAMIESLGAKAVPLSWGDVTTALASGVADGQFNAPYVNAYAKFWEVNKYSSYIGHVFNSGVWVASEKWFAKLPENQKTIILTTAREAAAIGRGVDAQQSLLDWEKGKKHFKDTYMPGTDATKEWKDILRPAFLNWITKDFGIAEEKVKALWAEVDRLKKENDDFIVNGK